MVRKKYSINVRYISRLLTGWGILALLLLTGCNNEGISSAKDKKISFVFNAIDETRASDDVFTDYTGTEFSVFATGYTPDYATAPSDKKNIMQNVKVTYNGNSCTTDEIYYWIDGQIHFAAYSPYDAGDMGITPPEAPYQAYHFEGKVPGDINYMYADQQLGTLDDFTNGVVPVNFRHALTQVKFQVKLSDSSGNKSLNIKSLHLKNIRHTGSADFAYDENIENKLWTVTKEFPLNSVYDANYLGDYGVDATDMNTITTEYKEFDEVLYLMPQTLYLASESAFPQLLEVTYAISTNGEEDEEVSATVPLNIGSIQQWTVNKSVLYSLVISPGNPLILTIEVQPWELDTFENEFSDIVTVNSDGKIVWSEGTYSEIVDDKVILLDDISTPAEFTFNIAGPKGGTWQAFFITKTGSSDAFTLSQNEGPVGTPCTVKVSAKTVNTSSVANQGELRFAVLKGSNILPVDALTTLSEERNYTIVQNINK